MEEAHALQVIINKILPGVIEAYNHFAPRWGYPKVTVQEVRKKLNKVKLEQYENGQEIEYIIRLPDIHLNFKSEKLNHQTDDDPRNERTIFKVGFYNHFEGESGWILYDIENLAKGNYDGDDRSYIDFLHRM